MITFYELGSLGRLGNQLFQYAALRALTLHQGCEAGIPNPDLVGWHGQKCLLNNFNLEASLLDKPKPAKTFYKETDPFCYDSNFWNVKDGTNISGFFQSTLYFKGYEKQIIKELTPKRELLELGKEYVNSLREDSSPIVSLHIRLGDSIDGTNRGAMRMFGEDSSQLDWDSFYGKYIRAAMDKFEGCKFLVFAGGARWTEENTTEIEWCKNIFKGDKFLFSNNARTVEDLCRIMACDHHILSPISSFGWWAAYLNTRKEKQVVAPLHYHSDKPEYTHREGFYPKEWILC